LKTFFQALLLLAMVGISGCAMRTSTSEPVRFRVMTYNIHHGEGLDGKVDLERIAELIQRERADIVALQEVDRGVARTHRRDLAGELAALTGMKSVFSNNFSFQGGEYGNAVLTRFPVVAWKNRHYSMLRPNEQRGLLELTLNLHGRAVIFLNTHIDHRKDDAERLLNVETIREVVRQHTGRPLILCGDFNDTPDSRTHRQLRSFLNDAWELVGQGDGLTFFDNQPHRRIDYVWIAPGKALLPLKASVISSDASDHLPLVVEMELH
jgi:endonuclease/exonuclease/phosphatase family metal-dependent hydrolase